MATMSEEIKQKIETSEQNAMEDDLACALAELELATKRVREAKSCLEAFKAVQTPLLGTKSQIRSAVRENEEAHIIGTFTSEFRIKQGETYNHPGGDLTLSCIPKNSTIIVTNGTLLVKGDVGEAANIKLLLTQTPQTDNSACPMIFSSSGKDGIITVPISNATFTIRNGIITVGAIHEIIIEGKVHKNARINSVGAITCQDVAENCVLEAYGDIVCKNIGSSTRLNTIDSSIRAENVSEGAHLITTNRSITVLNIAQKAKLQTTNGELRARSVDTYASLRTNNANIMVTDRVAVYAELMTSNGKIIVKHIEQGAFVSLSNAMNCYIGPTNMSINLNDLKRGDLIFTVSNKDGRYSGHVAVCYKENQDPKQLKSIHATDCRYYFSLCITKLNPSSRLLEGNNHYEVIRCLDQKLLNEALNIFEAWLPFQVPFDDNKRKEMEKYDHDEKKSIESKLLELRSEFNQENYELELAQFHSRRQTIPFFPNTQEGFFCSSAILLPFQIAALPENQDLAFDYRDSIPKSLQIDYRLVSPTTFMNSLLQESSKFIHLGKLHIEYKLDQLDEDRLERERLSLKQDAQKNVQHFLDDFSELTKTLNNFVPNDSIIEDAKPVQIILNFLYNFNSKKIQNNNLNKPQSTYTP